MAGFDDPGVFFSDSFAIDEQQDDQQLTRTIAQKKFKEFIREYHEDGLSFRYRYKSFNVFVTFCYRLIGQLLVSICISEIQLGLLFHSIQIELK